MPSDPRAIRIKVNTKHGASTAWLTAKTIAAMGRTGTPAIAATGRYAWVAFTDADTGTITVANNMGVNAEDVGWVAQDVATTTRGGSDEDGYEGEPVIAATGSTILLAWIDSDDGGLKVKVSTDNGQSWPDEATTITSEQVRGVSATASSGRAALAWVQSASSVKAKVWKAGLELTRTAASSLPRGSTGTGTGRPLHSPAPAASASPGPRALAAPARPALPRASTSGGASRRTTWPRGRRP